MNDRHDSSTNPALTPEQKCTAMIDALGKMSDVEIERLYQRLSYEFPKLFTSEKPNQRFIGTWKGSLKYMAPDFNEPLEDFKDYMPDDDFGFLYIKGRNSQ